MKKISTVLITSILFLGVSNVQARMGSPMKAWLGSEVDTYRYTQQDDEPSGEFHIPASFRMSAEDRRLGTTERTTRALRKRALNVYEARHKAREKERK